MKPIIFLTLISILMGSCGGSVSDKVSDRDSKVGLPCEFTPADLVADTAKSFPSCGQLPSAIRVIIEGVAATSGGDGLELSFYGQGTEGFFFLLSEDYVGISSNNDYLTSDCYGVPACDNSTGTPRNYCIEIGDITSKTNMKVFENTCTGTPLLEIDDSAPATGFITERGLTAYLYGASDITFTRVRVEGL